MEVLMKRLPVKFRMQVREQDFRDLEEIRLRVGRPLEFYYGNKGKGGSIRFWEKVETADIREMLNYLTGYSLYAYEEEIKKGFFTIEGGHRVGITGHTSMSEAEGRGLCGKISDVPEITGLNIRIARQIRGCALPVMRYIRYGKSIHSTLLIAPPGVGKTTFLRDMIRIISDGADGKPPCKVSIIDERSEIAACSQGIPQNDIGIRTDVLDNCPKRMGMEMILRSMSPEILAVDELGTEDVEAVEQILRCGCGIIGTVHGSSFEELREKDGIRRLLTRGGITRVIVLENDERGRRFLVFDDRGNRLCP